MADMIRPSRASRTAPLPPLERDVPAAGRVRLADRADALVLILRRWLFWILYALGLLIFLMFFFGQYLLAWFRTQIGDEPHPVGLAVLNPGELIELLADMLKLNGSAETYANSSVTRATWS